MKILVVGAGVIGSVYAAKLGAAGHEVILLARGRRLSDLEAHGLVVEEAESGKRTVVSVPVVSAPGADERYDVVLVPVRSEQLSSTLPILAGMRGAPDVLFFGNTCGQQAKLTEELGGRALFGFPAAGGVRAGPVVNYVLIRQQKTMLGEGTGASTSRLLDLQEMFSGAGFPTRISADIDGWMLGHTAFVVPIGYALYRAGTDAARLAADPVAVGLMVRAIREAFRALRAAGNTEIPVNLLILFLCLPAAVVVRYWRRVLASSRGELWFAAHTRAVPEEMHALADELEAAVRRTGWSTPNVDSLLSRPVPER